MNYGFPTALQLRSTFWKTLHKDFSIKSCQSKSSFKWFITIILSTPEERLLTLEVDKRAYLQRNGLALQQDQDEENFSLKTTLLSFVMKGNKTWFIEPIVICTFFLHLFECTFCNCYWEKVEEDLVINFDINSLLLVESGSVVICAIIN